jgi:hypothetical protein
LPPAEEEKKRKEKTGALASAQRRRRSQHRATVPPATTSSAVATTTASSTASTPPQVGLLSNHRRPCHASTVHVAYEQWRALFIRPRPCIWAGFGPFKKKLKKKYFSIFVISLFFDLCPFFLNINLYFTS